MISAYSLKSITPRIHTKSLLSVLSSKKHDSDYVQQKTFVG